MSRDSLPIALAVAGVLVLAVGGPWVAERLRGPAPGAALRVLPAAGAGQKRVTLRVTGMRCANCASPVIRALEATPGVAAAAVDVAAGRASVVCARGVADTSLVHAVARAGRGFEATLATR